MTPNEVPNIAIYDQVGQMYNVVALAALEHEILDPRLHPDSDYKKKRIRGSVDDWKPGI